MAEHRVGTGDVATGEGATDGGTAHRLVDSVCPGNQHERLDPEVVLRAELAEQSDVAFAMPAEREKALALGCNGYIEKPIAPLMLAGQVRSFLKQ